MSGQCHPHLVPGYGFCCLICGKAPRTGCSPSSSSSSCSSTSSGPLSQRPCFPGLRTASEGHQSKGTSQFQGSPSPVRPGRRWTPGSDHSHQSESPKPAPSSSQPPPHIRQICRFINSVIEMVNILVQ